MTPACQGFKVREYKDKLENALTWYGVPRRALNMRARGLDYRVTDMLGYMQPSASVYWQHYLYHALTEGAVIDRDDIRPITILDHRWHFGEHQWNFNPRKIEYQVRRALKGLNYLVIIEFEVFGNLQYREEWFEDGLQETCPHGRLITPHIQGLLWGKHPSRRQRAQFAGGIDNAPGIVLKRLTNFAGAVRYMVKPPYMGQEVHLRPDGSRVRYPLAAMPLKLHYLLFCRLHELILVSPI